VLSLPVGGTVSGMAVGPDGSFYLADRTGKLLHGYEPGFQKPLWEPISLPDSPEFLLYVGS
jgi:hypothetical protein